MVMVHVPMFPRMGGRWKVYRVGNGVIIIVPKAVQYHVNSRDINSRPLRSSYLLYNNISNQPLPRPPVSHALSMHLLRPIRRSYS